MVGMVVVMIQVRGDADRGRRWCIRCKGLHGRTIADGVSAKFLDGTAAKAAEVAKAVRMRKKMWKRSSLLMVRFPN